MSTVPFCEPVRTDTEHHSCYNLYMAPIHVTQHVHRLVDQLVPDRCVLCLTVMQSRSATLLCGYCWEALPWLAPHEAAATSQSWAYGKVTIPLRHTTYARFLVQQFKFQRRERAGQVLAQAMYEAVVHAYGNREKLPSALIPCPMAWRRMFSRGQNHAAVIAYRLHRQLGVAYRPVFGRRHTAPQQGKTRAARKALPDDTFFVKRPKRLDQIDHVALVDDVLTTGSTAQAMAHVLRQQGVQRIDLWCATRAL